MGAHMFYTDWAIVDIAGLVDVPMARHSDFNKRFLREYLFEERRPDFAMSMVAGPRLTDPESKFPDRYIEIPGYPIGTRKLHIENHINKNIFVSTTTRAASGERGWYLLVSGASRRLWCSGAHVFVDTTWRAPPRRRAPVWSRSLLQTAHGP